jgi:hypothetical protein
MNHGWPSSPPPCGPGPRGERYTLNLNDGRIVGFPADRFRIPAAATEEHLCHKGVPGIILTLHTFGEYLDFDPHVPALVADGLFARPSDNPGSSQAQESQILNPQPSPSTCRFTPFSAPAGCAS